MKRMSNRNVARIALGMAGAVGTLTLGLGSAHARELVYYQDWQEDNAFTARWTSTGGCATFSRDPGNPPPNPQQGAAPAPECSGAYATETILWSGGRTIATTTIPAASNNTFCVTAWIRAKSNGNGRARPFVGLNFSSNPGGFPADQGSIGGCRNGEHWLIGDEGFNDNQYRDNCSTVGQDNCCDGHSTTGYGTVTAVPANAAGWNFYAKEFTVSGTDVFNGRNNIILKLQNWSGGGNNSCPNPAIPNSAPGADFDDIRVYKLAPDEACPTAADVLAEGDDTHESCGGTTPFCTSRDVQIAVTGAPARTAPQTFCTGCTGSFGDGGERSCLAAAPACADDGSCQACNGDAGSAGTRKCGAEQPVCKADHTCGQCNDAQDCVAVDGISRAGAACVQGACTDSCTITPATGASPECGANRFCVIGAQAGCVNKLPNGAQIPVRAEESDAERGKCVLPADGGAHVTATLFCASGVCSKADDKCGLANGEACTAASGAAQCRAGVCGAGDLCGLTQGSSCTADAQCRDSQCIDGNCGGQQSECTVDIDCGPTGFVCDASKRCALGCRNGAGCETGLTCTSATEAIGECVPGQSSSSSSSGAASSSGGNSSGNNGSGGTSSGQGGSGGNSSGENGSGGAGGSSGGGEGGDEEGGGCSTSKSGSGSLTPLLLGLGVALGAFRRRRSSAGR